MSQSDLGSLSSREDVERVLTTLASRIDELEDELERERERRRELEQRLGPLEYQAPEDATPEQADHLDHYYVDGFPVGSFLRSRISDDDVEMIIDDYLSETGGAGEFDEEHALPVQQVRRAQKTGSTRLSPNEERAGTVWGAFFEEATTTPSTHVLDSSTVRTILRQSDGVEQVHDETVRRVMGLVAELGREYVALEQREGRNVLVVDRDEWEAFVQGFYEDDAAGETGGVVG